MKLKLNPHLNPFNLDNTLQCGQLFRWEKFGVWWYGVVEQHVIKMRQRSSVVEFKGTDYSFIESYFRLDDNLPQIISEINQDFPIKQATQAFPGLRITRQNPWECLISYICATYKNIPAIQNMILELATRFGNEIRFEGRCFYTFPEPDTLEKATLEELEQCRLGFRAKWVLEAAKIVSNGGINFGELKRFDYERAREELLQLRGVGNKVADCVLLFSLEKLEAFPIDVWIKRIVQRHYANYFSELIIRKLSTNNPLSQKTYETIGSFARKHFGKYAGYAQEYLFHFARSRLAK